jgi:hypothetical protein
MYLFQNEVETIPGVPGSYKAYDYRNALNDLELGVEGMTFHVMPYGSGNIDDSTDTRSVLQLGNFDEGPHATGGLVEAPGYIQGFTGIYMENDGTGGSPNIWSSSATGNTPFEYFRQQVSSANTNGSLIYQSASNTSKGIYSTWRNSGGTLAAPTATPADQALLENDAQSYTGTAWLNSVIFAAKSDGGASSGSSPGYYSFSTAPTGSTTPLERVRIGKGGIPLSVYSSTSSSFEPVCKVDGDQCPATTSAISGMTSTQLAVAGSASTITSSVAASTLNVNSALTASNVQCYLQDTCPNDAIWQAPWLTTSQPYLAAGYPLGATDTTMTIVTLAGMPATGHVVTTASEEIGYSYVSSSGGNSTYNITRAKHGSIAHAVPVAVSNMAGVVSETSACSTCGVLMQTVNVGGTTFGGQTNAGLEPTVGGSYAVFDAITMTRLNGHGGEFLEANPGADGAVIPSGYGAVSFDASGAAAARAAVGNCSAGQYGTATTTSGLTCAQVAYSQVSGTPSIPTVGTWGALNYPPWSSGTPFVKMTGLGTFSLDTNTYLTSSAIASTTNLLSGDGSGHAVSSGIAASNVPLLNAGNTFSVGQFLGSKISPVRTSVGGYIFSSNNESDPYVIWEGDGAGNDPIIDESAPGVYNLGYRTTGAIGSPTGINSTIRWGSDGNVSIGDTAAAAMFNVGTANQFQVTSTGVSSAGAGSTDLNGSGVPEAHCLADGTGGGACGGHNANATQTTVSCSTAGTATFSEPFTGASYKKVIYSVSGCQGTVSYTFPVAFTTGTVQLSQAGGANTVTNTSITWGSVSALTAIGVIEGW